MSRVWRTSAADAGDLESLVKTAISESRLAGSRVLVWHTGGGVAPSGIEPLLMERGFTLSEELEVLAFELWDGEPRYPDLGETETRAELARSVEGLREVGRVDAEVFGKPEPSEVDLQAWERELRESEKSGAMDGAVLRFLAHMPKSRAVAASGMQLADGVVRLWGSGTLPAYRGSGAYRALVRERCEAARRHGATLALAKANVSTSAPILRHAGFFRIAEEQRWELSL